MAEQLLAFEWFAGRDHKDVITITPGDTDRRAVAASVAPSQDHALVDWSPDGQTIAFVVGEWYFGTSIWTVGADGQEAVELLGPSDDCRLGVNFPAYSPDGKSLMYVCQDGVDGADPNLEMKLMVLDLASGASTEVVTVNLPDELLYPRWSNDGQTAVVNLFQWDSEPEEDVWIGSQVATVPISGGDIVRLTAADMWAGDPDWSPTEDLIVFGTYGILDKDMSRPSTIYTMRPDGSGQTVIAESAGDGLTRLTGPRWTPDGERLLISIAVGEGTEVTDVKLAFLELDGTVTRIPFGPDEDLSGVGARLQPMP
jgi:Tol biopolymer transport system component